MDNLEILRAYTKQFDGRGHTPADPDRIAKAAETYAREAAEICAWEFSDVLPSATVALERGASEHGLPLDEYVGALTCIAAYTGADVGAAAFEIRRVLETFRELGAHV